MSKKRGSGYYALRWQILERDNFTCQYCGQFAPNVKLEVDHIISVEEGGIDEPDNLTTSCFACNRGKSALRIITTRSKHRQAQPYCPKKTIYFRQTELVDLLKGHPNGLSKKEIAETLNISEGNTAVVLSRLRKKELIRSSMINDSKVYMLKVQ